MMTFIRRISRLTLPTYAFVYLAFLYLPVLLVILFSFNESSILAFPLKGLSFKWYGELGAQDELLAALRNSLMVGVIVSLVSTSLGSLAARAQTRFSFVGKAPTNALIMAPLVIPEFIIAISLLIMVLSLGIEPSLFTIILGHIFVTLPFAYSIMKSAFEQFDNTLEEAAIDLGETMWGALTRVTLPVVAPGLLSALLVSFTVSFDEFILSFFLAGNQSTLPIYIWSQVRFPEKLPITLALGSLLILGSFILLCLAEFFRRRSERFTGNSQIQVQ